MWTNRDTMNDEDWRKKVFRQHSSLPTASATVRIVVRREVVVKRASSRSARRPGFRWLEVELLEDRCLLSSGAIRDLAGFATEVLQRKDDGVSNQVQLGMTLNFLGQQETRLWVNTNGNVTFDSAFPTFKNNSLASTTREILAPFYSDVDTRNPASGLVTFGFDTIDGHRAFGVIWNGVGYFNQHADKTDRFQLVIIDRSDTGAGNFDLE